jgi:uncharacterized membrane protein
MAALGRLPPAQGIAAMNHINVTVINPAFMLAFLGTAVTCGLLVVLSLFRWHDPATPYRIAGGLLYLVGTILVTFAFNIPRNDALAAVTPDTAAAAELWKRYLSEWTAWNTVRTVAPLIASAVLALALRGRPAP